MRLFRAFQAFRRDTRANVAVLSCFALVPVVFGVGAGIDYSVAARRRSMLNLYADGAALLAVNQSMMSKTADQAKTAATAFFNAQAQSLAGATLTAPVTVSVIDTPGVNGTVRTASVAYTATSTNTFAGVIGAGNLAISGRIVSSATTAPNIDFYVMLDTSPSMAIAATTAGITTMVNATPQQGGCAFACHQTNPAADNLGNPNGVDNYQLARNLNVALRMDLVVDAATNLPSYATKVSQQNGAKYRMGIYTFDWQWSRVQAITSNMTTVQQQAAGVQMLTVYKNGWRTATVNDNDQNTSWTSSMASMNSEMPTAGLGTNNVGDTPQETLFIVTDGVVDENNGGRQIYAMGGNACSTIKAKGIKIAILYTTYNPLPTNSFYNTYVKPFQPNIASTLQACASSGLFSVVNTNDDISAALQNLFNKATATAHLTT